jgi:hypothetical protein
MTAARFGAEPWAFAAFPPASPAGKQLSPESGQNVEKPHKQAFFCHIAFPYPL